MGADIHVTLGYVKKEAIARIENAKPNVKQLEPESRAIVIRNTSLKLSDLRLEKCDSDSEPNRNYRLFSWLSDVRGSVKPFCGSKKDNDHWQNITSQLMEFLAEESGDDKWDYLYSITSGDHSFQFFTVAELVFFDYDQVFEVDPRWYHDELLPNLREEYKHLDYDEEIWVPNPSKQTFKDIFFWEHRERKGNWFYFLEMLKTEKVDFIIIGFDN